MFSACIVQLPFPSTSAPNKHISDYYLDYERRFQSFFRDYFTPQDSLWEMPLWVAHLTALLDSATIESSFCDLSRAEPDPLSCSIAICAQTKSDDIVMMSPLAQNFDLALGVAKELRATGRRVVLGGNMAPLAPPGSVHLVHRGQLNTSLVVRLAARATGAGGLQVHQSREGMAAESITWAPDYRHLQGYAGDVPLLRLNASHGCLYRCSFCGDAWSKQLTLVDAPALAEEVDELTSRFPATRLIYIGDKTFGQSKQAVSNLIKVFAGRTGYRFIVQTHVLQVRSWLLDAMAELGVAVVELGFESGDTQMLKHHDKLSHGLDDYTEKIRILNEAGFKIVLNIMGGLDSETEVSHAQTIQWLSDQRALLWLFNLYNYVPYPLTPEFPMIRKKIFNWNYADWREDKPVIYTPAHLSPERSWELFLEKVAVTHDLIRSSPADPAEGSPR